MNVSKKGYCFTIHGARGSFPAIGRQFLKYGGHTTCFSLATPVGWLVIDAGTGIVSLNEAWRNAPADLPVALFFTHFHLDHVACLPTFAPLLHPASRVTLFGNRRDYPDWRKALQQLAAPPYWPLKISAAGKRIQWRDLPAGNNLEWGNARVAWQSVPHPQPCLAYRLEAKRKNIVIVTDYEPGNDASMRLLRSFCSGADILIVDAQFAPEEYQHYRGWGHATWAEGCRLADAAGARELVLTHHAPQRTDREIAALERAARRVFPAACAACDGMQWRWI